MKKKDSIKWFEIYKLLFRNPVLPFVYILVTMILILGATNDWGLTEEGGILALIPLGYWFYILWVGLDDEK